MDSSHDDELITPDRVVSEYFKGAVTSKSTLANWRYRGEGPRYVKLGRSVLYRRADILSFISSRFHDPEAGLNG